MRFRTEMLFCLSLLAVPHTVARAQELKPYSLQFNTDLRARIGSTGASKATAYDNAVGLGLRLAPGWQFRYTGGQQNANGLTGYGGIFNKFVTQEAALERQWASGLRMELGIVRLPFGLYDNREMYAAGIIDYPLLRGDYALQSVNWGVPGIRIGGGSPRLQGELAVFGGQSAGMWNNLNNTRGVAGRIQVYQGNLILGVSHWNGSQSVSRRNPGERGTQVTGLDMRYTLPHLLLRGEYLAGNLGGERADGWYLDFYYHLPKYEKFTFVGRVEEFRPKSNSGIGKQWTLGLRYTLNSDWILALNWRRNNGIPYSGTWTPPTTRSGDLFFQVYHKFNL